MREMKEKSCSTLPHDFHVLQIERASQHCEKQSTKKKKRIEEKKKTIRAECRMERKRRSEEEW
jgi:hypothetical protein